MKKRKHGPSLYYVSDKNIYDALNQHKIDAATISRLLLTRRIVAGSKTPRTDIAKYFSCLTHDYYDHQAIAQKLGIIPRRERVTSVDLNGSILEENIRSAADQLKTDLESAGDVVRILRRENSISIEVQYSIVDYGRSEFAQVQIRDGTIEFVKSQNGYVVRSTKNTHIDDIRDSLLGRIEKLMEEKLERRSIDLSAFPDPQSRSKFFYDLVTSLPDFSLRDVTGVYVYKPKPESMLFDFEADDVDEENAHVERVHLRGNGVSRSEILRELLESDDYYITRIAWRSKEIFDRGYEYDMEALFSDPSHCTGFSYLVGGVYVVEMGRRSQRRTPSREETDHISRIIEGKARQILTAMEEKFVEGNAEESQNATEI